MKTALIHYYYPTGRVSRESFLTEVYNEHIKLRPVDIDDVQKYESTCKMVIEHLCDSFFKLPKLSYLNLDRDICFRKDWDEIDFQVNIDFCSFEIEYVNNQKKEYQHKITDRYEHLSNNYNEDLTPMCETIKRDLEQVKTCLDLIVEIYGCEKGYSFLLEELTLRKELSEEDQRNEQVEKKRKRRNQKVSPKSNPTSLEDENLFGTESSESQKALEELLDEESMKDEKLKIKEKKKANKKEKKNRKKEEQRTLHIKYKWISLGNRERFKKCYQSLLLILLLRKSSLVKIQGKIRQFYSIRYVNKLRTTRLIQSWYRSYYYNQLFEKRRINIIKIQTKVKIWLSKKKRIYRNQLLKKFIVRTSKINSLKPSLEKIKDSGSANNILISSIPQPQIKSSRKLCKYYLANTTCPWNENCRYSHGEQDYNDINYNMNNNTECWYGRFCTKCNCPYIHPEGKNNFTICHSVMAN